MHHRMARYPPVSCRVIRNKSSHFFEETLSSGEVAVLREGGFSDAVVDEQFGVNPRMYRRTVEQIGNFFGLVLAKLGSAS